MKESTCGARSRPSVVNGLYRIVSGPPDETEAWRFPLGSVVRCEEKTFSGGRKGLVARERVS